MSLRILRNVLTLGSFVGSVGFASLASAHPVPGPVPMPTPSPNAYPSAEWRGDEGEEEPVYHPRFYSAGGSYYGYYRQPVEGVAVDPGPPAFGVTLGGSLEALSGESFSYALKGWNVAARYLIDPHLAIEGSFSNLTGNSANGVRTDQPITAGLDLFICGHTLLPYVSVAGGVEEVHFEAAGFGQDMTDWIGGAGAGVELRLGRFFAIDADLRYVHRFGTTSRVFQPLEPSAATGSSFNGTLSLTAYL